MKDKDRKKINRWKHEYQAYLTYEDRLNELATIRQELDARMGVHSPGFSDARVQNPQSRDSRLANYAETMKTIEDEERFIKTQMARIEAVMALIPDRYMKVIRQVYKGINDYAYWCSEYNCSRTVLQYRCDVAILRAIKQREPH